jgi:hypothetical protein
MAGETPGYRRCLSLRLRRGRPPRSAPASSSSRHQGTQGQSVVRSRRRQAARRYSWIRPPKTSMHSIRSPPCAPLTSPAAGVHAGLALVPAQEPSDRHRDPLGQPIVAAAGLVSRRLIGGVPGMSQPPRNPGRDADRLGAEAMTRLRARSVCAVEDGLTDDEIACIEETLGFRFVDDHRAFLAAGLPLHARGGPCLRGHDE